VRSTCSTTVICTTSGSLQRKWLRRAAERLDMAIQPSAPRCGNLEGPWLPVVRSLPVAVWRLPRLGRPPSLAPRNLQIDQAIPTKSRGSQRQGLPTGGRTVRRISSWPRMRAGTVRHAIVAARVPRRRIRATAGRVGLHHLDVDLAGSRHRATEPALTANAWSSPVDRKRALCLCAQARSGTSHISAQLPVLRPLVIRRCAQPWIAVRDPGVAAALVGESKTAADGGVSARGLGCSRSAVGPCGQSLMREWRLLGHCDGVQEEIYPSAHAVASTTLCDAGGVCVR